MRNGTLGLIAALALLAPVALSQSKKWEGPALDLTVGLNVGINKILVRLDMIPGKYPYCSVLARRIDEAELFNDVFGAWSRKGWDFVESSEVREEGNDWTAYRFKSPNGRTVDICHPVRAIGPKIMKHFRTHDFAVSAAKLPHALMLLTGDKTLPFPLRDISSFEDPKYALLRDLVPMERNADMLRVRRYLSQRLLRNAKDEKKVIETLQQINRLTDPEIAYFQTTLLSFRTHKNTSVAAEATSICKKRGFFGPKELKAAIDAATGSKDEGAIKSALAVFEKLGRQQNPQTLAALKALASRQEVADALRARARKLLPEK